MIRPQNDSTCRSAHVHQRHEGAALLVIVPVGGSRLT